MVRLADPNDIDGFVTYLSTHIAESGRDGDPVYSVQSDGEPFDPVGFAERVVERWAVPSGVGGWQRTFIALDGGDGGAGTIVGHCELSADTMPFTRHRVDLSLGVLRSARRRGLGGGLLSAAIDWARREPGLTWIDLGVFVPNPIAISMYERAGFECTGLVRDRFRMGDMRLDEMTMTLAVSD